MPWNFSFGVWASALLNSGKSCLIISLTSGSSTNLTSSFPGTHNIVILLLLKSPHSSHTRLSSFFCFLFLEVSYISSCGSSIFPSAAIRVLALNYFTITLHPLYLCHFWLSPGLFSPFSGDALHTSLGAWSARVTESGAPEVQSSPLGVSE